MQSVFSTFLWVGVGIPTPTEGFLRRQLMGVSASPVPARRMAQCRDHASDILDGKKPEISPARLGSSGIRPAAALMVVRASGAIAHA